MSEYFTVVYRAKNKEAARDFFEKEISSKSCAIGANQDFPIQVTGWAIGDTLLELEELTNKNNKE